MRVGAIAAFGNCVIKTLSSPRCFLGFSPSLRWLLLGFLSVFALACHASAQSVGLSWNADSDPTVTGYVVFYGTSSGNYTQTIDVGNVTAAAVPNLSAGTTYYLAVAAYNGAGIQSDVSNEVSGIPSSSSSSSSIPAAPTSVSATAGNAQVALNWAAVSGATSYNVKRSATSGGPYTTVATVTSASATDSSVTNGAVYYYVVTAVNSSGESNNSSEVSATPQAPVPATPAPSGLTASAGNALVTLNWTASSGATSYNVKRSTTSGGPYTTIGSPSSTFASDSSVTNGITYYYVVSAANSAGESANSSEVSATPAAPAPGTPGSLTASAGNGAVSLAWNTASNATGYNLKRSTSSGGPYTTVASVTSTSITDSSLANGTTYYYVVSATNGSGESANSAQASATPSAPVPPASPTGLAASPGNAQVSLTWNTTAGAASYNVKRSTTSGGPFTTIGTATTASANDTTVANGTTYYYVVSAVSGAGESANSAQVSAAPTALPSPWVTADIGSVGGGGAASYASGTFTESGSGAGFGGTSDAFRYLYQPATSNGSIIVKVATSQSGGSAGATGVMMRDSLTANAIYAGLFVTPNNGIVYEWRASTGGTTSRVTATVTGPVWLQLSYNPSGCKASYSTNGSTWIQIAPKKSAAFGSSYSLGMAVTSGVAGVTSTSTFSNVTAVP